MSRGSKTQLGEPGDVNETRLSSEGAAALPPGPARSSSRQLRKRTADYGVVIALFVMVLAFSLAMPEKFATWPNAKNILVEQAIPGMLALAVVLPLTVGEFDLSVGATLGFTSVVSAYAATKGVSVAIILPVCLAIGSIVGAVNVSLVRIGVNAFIATLGVSTILVGGNLLVTQGAVLSTGNGAPITTIAQTELFGIRLTVFYLLALAIALYYILEWTPAGRYLRGTGFGRDASRLSGVRTGSWLQWAFIAAGAIAGFAGFLQTSTIASASPSVGPEFLLPAYAAAFLGATTIVRGFFNVWGTIVGVFLLAVGTTGLALAGAPSWIQPVFNGTALVVAVTVAVVAEKLRRP